MRVVRLAAINGGDDPRQETVRAAKEVERNEWLAMTYLLRRIYLLLFWRIHDFLVLPISYDFRTQKRSP